MLPYHLAEWGEEHPPTAAAAAHTWGRARAAAVAVSWEPLESAGARPRRSPAPSQSLGLSGPAIPSPSHAAPQTTPEPWSHCGARPRSWDLLPLHPPPVTGALRHRALPPRDTSFPEGSVPREFRGQFQLCRSVVWKRSDRSVHPCGPHRNDDEGHFHRPRSGPVLRSGHQPQPSSGPLTAAAFCHNRLDVI